MIQVTSIRWRRPWLPLVMTAAALLAGCSTAGVATIGGGDATPTPTATAASDPEEALLAFTECMREQGIDMPDPVIVRFGDGDGAGGGTASGPQDAEAMPDPNSEEFQAADEVCGHHLESLGSLEPGTGPELSPEEEEAFLAFAECMREQGIDMPDMGAGGAIRMAPEDGAAVDPGDPEFQAAEEVCREHLDALPQPEEAQP